MWLKEWDKTVTRNCYFWLIKTGSVYVIEDSGVTSELAEGRNLNGHICPDELLLQMDIKAADIQHVILDPSALGSRRRDIPVSQRKGLHTGGRVSLLAE